MHVGVFYCWDLKGATLFLSVRWKMEEGSWLQERPGNGVKLRSRKASGFDEGTAVSATDLRPGVCTSGPG